jgi:mannose-6-phosphate isomerase
VLYPLTFQPIFKERVWGGRRLAELYGKALPPGARVGESWEISDRPGDTSVIANGPLAGKDLRWLMENHAPDLLGDARPFNGHFPLLVKILDAHETLSLQVHPSAAKAAQLGGEPKTELWHITAAAPDAELFVGLKHGVTRAEFERRIQDRTVAECFHRLPVRAGDSMFLPSGRVHALGAGIVLFEIQQNSDTTYRVFDWNRAGLDGKPRELHLAQSLASIDFDDFEPRLIPKQTTVEQGCEVQPLVNDSLFAVDAVSLKPGQTISWLTPRCLILGVLEDSLTLIAGGLTLQMVTGQFSLIPACLEKVDLRAERAARFLRIIPA